MLQINKRLWLTLCIVVILVSIVCLACSTILITTSIAHKNEVTSLQETIQEKDVMIQNLNQQIDQFNGIGEVSEDVHYNYFMGIDYRIFSYDTLQFNQEMTDMWQDHFTNWLRLNGIDPNPALDNNGYIINEGLFYRFDSMMDPVELPTMTDSDQLWASDPQTPDGVSGYGSDYVEPEVDESPSYYELLKVDANGNLVMKDGSTEIYPEIIEEFNAWMSDYSDPTDTEYSRLEKYYGWYGVDVTERQQALMGGSDR